MSPKELIIVTGLSGSGKSVAMKTLEDLGIYCVDNLPLGLIDALLDQGHSQGYALDTMALGLDVRSQLQSPKALPETLKSTRERIPRTRVIFLSADESALIRRYSETRRRHPLHRGDQSLAEAIRRERELLMPVAAHADVFIDTSSLSVHQLRREIYERLGRGDQPMVLLIESFAYKNGVPPDADVVFDVRCLPNPHWEAELRPLSGREPAVRDYLERHAVVGEMIADIGRWLDRWLGEFDSQQRSYFTVAIGCTGGKHRSVYVAEELARHFQGRRQQVISYHRELL